jgi:phospholipid N-methyltransferase
VQKAIGIEQRNRMDALGKKYDESKVIDGHATTINQETGEVQSATVDPDGSFPG